MADVIGMSDVSSPDTGKGSQLKTGGRRKHNMPSKEKCAKEWKKLGYSSAAACRNYKPKTQKAGTSSESEQNKVGKDMAKSNNWRMKRRLKRQAESGPKGY